MILEKILDNFYVFRKKAYSDFKEFLSFLHIKILIFFIFFVNALNWLLARFILNRIDSKQMALHYNVDFGINYYADSKNIFILPFLGFFLFFVNFFLFFFFLKHKDRVFISYLLFSVALFVNIILLASTSSVYLVNFR